MFIKNNNMYVCSSEVADKVYTDAIASINEQANIKDSSLSWEGNLYDKLINDMVAVVIAAHFVNTQDVKVLLDANNPFTRISVISPAHNRTIIVTVGIVTGEDTKQTVLAGVLYE